MGTLNDLTKEKLYELYWKKELSTSEIADKYEDANSNKIYYRLNKWDIGTRSIREAQELNWKKGKYEDAEHKGNPGWEHTEKMKKHLSKANSGENNYWHGRKLSEQHRQKIRETKAEKLKKNEIKPQYNEEACKVFNTLNQKFGWNIQHAENEKEKYVCGFWVDGYEPNLNLVIEYDERHHFREGKLKQKDRKRENKIKDELNCKLVRIRSKDRKAYRGDEKSIKKLNSVI